MRKYEMQIVNAVLALALAFPCAAFAMGQGEASREAAPVMKTEPARAQRTIETLDLRENGIEQVNGAEDLGAAQMETETSLGGLPVDRQVLREMALAPQAQMAAPSRVQQRGAFGRAIAGLASLFKPEVSGARFDQAMPEAMAAYVRAPNQGTEEYAKISRAVDLALSQGTPDLDVGVGDMFNSLQQNGGRPVIRIETNGANEYVRTTGDDKENPGEARQIIIGQGALSNWTDKALAAALAYGYAYHFYADNLPESAERVYKAVSIAVRHFINISGQSHGAMSDPDSANWSWTRDDSYGSNGKPFWMSITSRWHDGLGDENDVRRGTLFLKNIMQGWGDPAVSVKDSRSRETLSQRYQREGDYNAWYQRTGQLFSQAVSAAQNSFGGFANKEVQWFKTFKNVRP